MQILLMKSLHMLFCESCISLALFRGFKESTSFLYIKYQLYELKCNLQLYVMTSFPFPSRFCASNYSFPSKNHLFTPKLYFINLVVWCNVCEAFKSRLFFLFYCIIYTIVIPFNLSRKNIVCKKSS